MGSGFRHEVFEQWRYRRCAERGVQARRATAGMTLDIEEAARLFLADRPEDRPHARALMEYLRTRYPHGVHQPAETLAAGLR